MYKIGDFSRLGQVSVRMLRHYDQIGLLKPDSVDFYSGYRKYSIQQLPILNRLVFLKELGFSLHEVKELLERNLDLKELKAIHLEKKKALEAELQTAKNKLEMINSRLGQIENEGREPLYEIVTKSYGSFRMAAVREIVPHMKEMGKYCEAMHNRLYASLEKYKIKPCGHEITIYHNNEYSDENIDVEMGIKIEEKDLKGENKTLDLNLVQVPAEKTVASLLYRGPYKDLPSPVLALLSWIGMNRKTMTGAVREIHLSGPAHDKEGRVQEDPVIELQIPINS